jgi:DNA end-binding protein Ku
VEGEAPWDLGRWSAEGEAPAAAAESAATPAEEPAQPQTEHIPEPQPERGAFEAWDRPARAEQEVGYGDVVKGFEVEPGRYVMLEREELEALRPTADRTIHIERFVPLEQIDPVYFEKSYYLAPGSPAEARAGAERAYGLLLTALEQAGRVGVGRFVMRTREYLAAVRPMDGVLGLETLFFSDEVRRAADVLPYGLPGDASERELSVAMKLIEVMATDWDPGEYADTYRERVMELIERKAEGLEPVTEEEPAPRPEMADLLAALRQSVEDAKVRSGEGTKKPRRRRASG